MVFYVKVLLKWNVILMHDSADFLRQVVVLSRTGVVSVGNFTYLRAWFFMMGWFWLFYVPLFLSFYVFSYNFVNFCTSSRRACQQTNFFPGWLFFMQWGYWKTQKVIEYFFHTSGILYPPYATLTSFVISLKIFGHERVKNRRRIDL